MSAARGPRQRTRGSVERLPSGALRVRVYAGKDPVTGRQHYLTEVVPAGPRAAADAEKVRTRLLSQVDERRNPKTRATVDQLLNRYLEVLDVEETTRRAYVGYIDRYIRSVLGALPLGRVTGEVLDSFYAQLRRCRKRCDAKTRQVDHRTQEVHECRPLAASTVRQIHWILSGAFDRAVRWNWVGISPVRTAEPPSPPRPHPQPPSPHDAARILAEAWVDPDWGTFLWVAVTTGARRGELCALRRSYLDLDQAILTVPASVHGTRESMREKDTKTHQQRRIALDPDTVMILAEHLHRQDQVAAQLGIAVAGDGFLFSRDPDCARPQVPDSVTQRYERLVARLGIDTTLHKLRHYNATELLASGVDLRTVAGRMGHSGGGTTTLKVYAAWVDQADRQAAVKLAGRLPKRTQTNEPVDP